MRNIAMIAILGFVGTIQSSSAEGLDPKNGLFCYNMKDTFALCPNTGSNAIISGGNRESRLLKVQCDDKNNSFSCVVPQAASTHFDHFEFFYASDLSVDGVDPEILSSRGSYRSNLGHVLGEQFFCQYERYEDVIKGMCKK